MTQKIGRRYRLEITPSDGGDAIVVELPFTVQFTLKRDLAASLNNLTIDIYNLSLENRRRIYQDRWDLAENKGVSGNLSRMKIVFQVGYDQLYEIFNGEVLSASSAREGVDIVTRLESLAGEFTIAASQVFLTVEKGQTLESVFNILGGELANVQKGKIGKFLYTFPRSVVLDGRTTEVINKYVKMTGANFYIDNGYYYILNSDEALNIEIAQINETTGILETPRREQASLTVTTLLESRIQINQLVDLESTIEPVYNGRYKVNGLQHSGVISAAFSGQCRSTFFLLAESNFFRYSKEQKGFTLV